MLLSTIAIAELYSELITTIVPGPASWSYFVPLFLLPLGLSIPSSILSHDQLGALIVPISFIATVHAWAVLGGNDVISTDCLYLTLFLYIFKDPRRDFRRVIRPVASQVPGSRNYEKVAEPERVSLEAHPKTLPGRLVWAMVLSQSRPLHDWIIGNPGHDRRVLNTFQHPTRFEFMMDIFSRLVPVLSIFLSLSRQLAKHDPYFSDPKWSVFSPSGSGGSGEGKVADLFRAVLPLFMLRPLVMAMYAYSLLIVMFLPPMLVPVLLSAVRLIPDKWSPHTWRPHFGPFSAITRYGVRGFWGRWWHQQMRHIVSEPGRWFAAKLGLANHGWQKTFKYMLICVSAFILSGITHSGLVPPKPRFATVGANELRLKLASFFWIQPVGIAVELFVLEPALRSLPSSMRGLQGLLRVMWAATFMCFACTFLVLPFGQLGYWNLIPSEHLPYLP